MKPRLYLLLLGLVFWSSSRSQDVCTFVGDAVGLGGGCYAITENVLQQVGAVWFNDQVDLNQEFTIRAEVFLGTQDATGADGIAFVMQEFGPFALGGINEFLGSDVPGNSLGVEIDTWENGNFADPVQDHVCIFRDGVNNHNIPFYNLDGPVSARSDGANIEDGQPHQFKVVWDPVGQVFEVYFDCELRLSWTGDLVGEIFQGESSVWWGFTGSTGGSSNAQEVCVTTSALGLPPEHFMCEGADVELVLQGAQSGTISWTPVDGLSDPSAAVTSAQPAVTTDYEVVWTDVCGDVLTEETTVEVLAAPDPTLPATAEFCPGEQVTLSVTVPAGGTAEWTDGTMGGDWTGDATGVQTVEVTGDGGCTGTASTTIAALYPNAASLPATGPLCLGISEDIPWPSGTQDWTVDGAPVVSPWQAEAGLFNLTYTDIATGCPLELDYAVDLLVPDIPTLPSDFAVCAGAGVNLTLDAGAGANVMWSPAGDLDDAAAEQPLATPLVTTVYDAAVTDVCGSTSTLTATVSVYPTPDPGLPDTVSLCPGQQATLNIVPLAGVADPQWSDGSTGWSWTGDAAGWQSVTVSPLPECAGEDSTYVVPQNATAPDFDVPPLCPGDFVFIPWPSGWEDWEVDGAAADPSGLTVTEPGVYFFVANEAASGCDVAGAIAVPTGELFPMVLPEYIELCEGQSQSVNTGVPDPVYWDDGETGNIRVVSESGLYVATHSTDCGTVTDSLVVVEVPCGCAVFAPSGFTPDGDLINDAWRPVFECSPEEYSLKIFDRWGGLVWQTQDSEEYWTGGAREDGRPLDEKLFFVRDGIYAFQVTYRDPTSVVRKIIQKTGHIKILR